MKHVRRQSTQTYFDRLTRCRWNASYMRRWTYVVLAGCLFSSGCVALAVGGGAAGLAYATGSVQRMYPHPVGDVWDATLAALDELELPKGMQVKDQLKARIERYTATGDRVLVKLASRGTFTELTLRVNAFGNKQMSLAILRKIEAHLPQEDLEVVEVDDTDR